MRDCQDCGVTFAEDESPVDERCVCCFVRWADHNPAQLSFDFELRSVIS